MSIDVYRGYIVEGFARPAEKGAFESLARVTRSGRVIKESDVLGLYDSSDGAQGRAIFWARTYVDQLESRQPA